MHEVVKKLTRKLSSRKWAFTLTMMNALAMVAVIQNVNSTCFWLDHQPEVPDEAKRFKKF